MRMSISSRLCLFVLLIFPSSSFAIGFQTFSQEVLSAKLVLDCSSEEYIPARKDFGALYICTFGKAKTARWYVSENYKTGGVQTVGLLWVDWQIDGGYGIRADWKEVEKALDFFIYWYVPAKRNDLTKAFWDSENENFSTSDFAIYYTCSPEPGKDERIIIIEEK